eukprot:jgi/Mesvir1/2433/Mv22165-RA.1
MVAQIIVSSCLPAKKHACLPRGIPANLFGQEPLRLPLRRSVPARKCAHPARASLNVQEGKAPHQLRFWGINEPANKKSSAQCSPDREPRVRGPLLALGLSALLLSAAPADYSLLNVPEVVAEEMLAGSPAEHRMTPLPLLEPHMLSCPLIRYSGMPGDVDGPAPAPGAPTCIACADGKTINPAVEECPDDDFPLWVDLVAGFVASFACTSAMYPVDTLKTRVQSGQSAWPDNGIFGLYRGIEFGLGKECPNSAIYIAVYEYLKVWFESLPFLDESNLTVAYLIIMMSGALGDAAGSIIRVPLELINKQIQTGLADNLGEALTRLREDSENPTRTFLISWAAVLARDMPFGALQLVFFEQVKEMLQFLGPEYGVPLLLQRMLWGALAGGLAAWITTPVDVLTTIVMTNVSEEELEEATHVVDDPLPLIFVDAGQVSSMQTHDQLGAGAVLVNTTGGEMDIELMNGTIFDTAAAAASTTLIQVPASGPKQQQKQMAVNGAATLPLEVSGEVRIPEQRRMAPVGAGEFRQLVFATSGGGGDGGGGEGEGEGGVDRWVPLVTGRAGMSSISVRRSPEDDDPPLEHYLALDQHHATNSNVELVKQASMKVWETDGLLGLFKGAVPRALYFAPGACIFFAVFETVEQGLAQWIQTQ